MPPPDFRCLTVVCLDRIDLNDQTFAITPDWFSIEALTAAVRRVGLLCPPRIECVGSERYRVVCGFRRLRAASRLGASNVECLVRSGDPVQLFVEALYDNASSRPLHLLEKANAVWKLTQLFSIAQREVIGEFLPVLGVKPNRFEMNRLLNVAKLPRVLQEAIVLEGVQPEIALGVAGWNHDEQAAYLQATHALRPGFSRQKELFTLLDELRARDGESIVRLLSGSDTGNLDGLLQNLRSRRLPKVSEYERLYQERKARLRLPPEIQFNPPPFFEGEKIQIGFAVRSPAELHALAGRLQQMADRPELAEIFGML